MDSSRLRTVATPPKNPSRLQPLMFTSPRCEGDDEDLLLHKESLREHEDRWDHMSRQAGEHRQDGTVLILTHRILSPQSLRVGVPPQVAARVRELHLPDHGSVLPEWLDVVSSLFFKLQHLKLATSNDANTECGRIRRLYILYRLPDLRSIDGRHVTELERQLARPNSPNGYKVARDDWLPSSSFLLYSDSSDDGETEREGHTHGDAVEVNIFGVVKRVSVDPPKDDWDEPGSPSLYAQSRRKPTNEKSTPNRTMSREPAYRTMHKTIGYMTQSLPLLSPKPSKSAELIEDESCLQQVNPCGRGSIFGISANDDAPLATNYTATFPSDSSNGSVPGRGSAMSSSLSLLSPIGEPRGRLVLELSPSPDCVTPPINETSNLKLTLSRSLSSPFPMQFRSASFNATSPLPTTEERETFQKGSTSPKRERCSSLDSERNDLLPADTVDAALPMCPVLESPDATGKRVPRKSLSKSDRPPPCPGSRRVAPLSSILTRKGRRGLVRWRIKSSIRATSIVDNDEDDLNSSDEEEDNI